MPLTQQQLTTFQSWVNNRVPNYSCPACHQANFSTGEIIASPTFQNGGIAIGGPTVPMVSLICNHCAHVTLFASIPLGL